MLLEEAQPEGVTEGDELDALQATQQVSDTQTVPPLSRSSTPLKRDISQLLINLSKLSTNNNASKKTKNSVIFLLVKQMSNRLSNPLDESNLKVRAIKILQSENDDLLEDEFNVALDIVERHATVFITLSTQRRSNWLSAKIKAAVEGSSSST